MKLIRVGAVAATLFVVLTAFLFWLQNGGQLTQPKKAYTHVHCPECQLEAAFSSGLEGKTCPQCGSSGPSMIATVGPRRGAAAGGELSVGGKLLAAGFVALVITLAFVYGWLLRYRARQRTEMREQNRMLVCRCPFCSRRIGYSAKKRGSGTQCPRCKTAFALTEGEEQDDARDAHP